MRTHTRNNEETLLCIYICTGEREGGGDSHKNKREGGVVAKTLFLCGLAMSDRFARVFVVLFSRLKSFF